MNAITFRSLRRERNATLRRFIAALRNNRGALLCMAGIAALAVLGSWLETMTYTVK